MSSHCVRFWLFSTSILELIWCIDNFDTKANDIQGKVFALECLCGAFLASFVLIGSVTVSFLIFKFNN